MKPFHTLGVLVLSTLGVLAQGTAFTYQGRLNDINGPANGTYDMRFAAFDALTGNGIASGVVTNSGIPVTNGLFTITLDLGAGVFNGSDRWLQIGVRSNGVGNFTTLSPRQPITPTPYAMQAANASSAATATFAATANSVAAGNISGTIALTQLPGTVLTNNASGG